MNNIIYHDFKKSPNQNKPKNCVNFSNCTNFEAEIYSINFEEFTYHNNRKPGDEYYIGAQIGIDEGEFPVIDIQFSEMLIAYIMPLDEAKKLVNVLLECIKELEPPLSSA
jgi:hypothetical protein